MVIFLTLSCPNTVRAESPLYRDSAYQLVNEMLADYGQAYNNTSFQKVTYAGLSKDNDSFYDTYEAEFGPSVHIVKIRLLCDVGTGWVMKAKVTFNIHDEMSNQLSHEVCNLLEHRLGVTEAENDALWGSIIDIRDDLFVGHSWCNALGAELQLILSMINEDDLEYSFAVI